MKKRTLAVALLLAGFGASSMACAYTGEELENQAKLTLKEAHAIALKARPGLITDEELEQEQGGSGLRYSFVILSQEQLWEVGVDAATGKILEDAIEGPNPD